ncbi:P-loop containing nucleoside triphosphate hydrolase [Phytophthora cactorum]|nr:P-loop containing nucleoside triphosphate hydrolase [Phytophthora cactorum]
MGGFASHDLLAYQAEGEASSEMDYRGSLRMLTDMLTRQHTAKKHRGKLLLLGLDGAGKSTLVNHLSRISIGADMALYTAKGLELPSYLYPDPTRTLQTASYRVDNSDKYLQLVDLPGHAIRFPIVATELVRLLKHKPKHKSFTNTQVFLVFNKIDHFLPPLPAETPEEPEAKEYQQLLNKHKQQQRAAIRKLVESSGNVSIRLKMDQRRHPVNLRASTAAASSNSKSLFFATPAAVAAELGPSSNQGRRNSHSTGASAVTNSFVVSSIFTNAVECCAQDRDSVRALCGWLNEELRKAPPS